MGKVRVSRAELDRIENKKRVISYKENNNWFKKKFKALKIWYRLKTGYMDYELTRSLRREKPKNINWDKLKSTLIVGKLYKDLRNGRYYMLKGVHSGKYSFQFRGPNRKASIEHFDVMESACKTTRGFMKYKLFKRSYRYSLILPLYKLTKYKRIKLFPYLIVRIFTF